MSAAMTNSGQVIWYFSAGDATFTCEGSWSTGVSIRARYNGNIYGAVINDLESCRNPTAPQAIDWTKCVKWDLLGQGSDQGDILGVVHEGDVLVLTVKRQHRRFMVKIGSFKLQLREAAQSLEGKDEDEMRHLIQTIQDQRELIERQRQEISGLKSQLEELVKTHSSDRAKLVDRMVELLNQKKQKITELQTFQTEGTNPVDTKVSIDSIIKQEPSVDFHVATPVAQIDEAGPNESDTETTDDDQ